MTGEKIIPVFPLPNVLLFPKVHLPLHIFEPRYRQMVRDVMAGERLIGMALLRGDWEKDYYGNPEIYAVGCVGRVVRSLPFPDGRYNITLQGLGEYEILEQILDRTLYRQARVRFREKAPSEGLARAAREEILGLIARLAHDRESQLLRVLGDPKLEDEIWLNLCCSTLDIPPLEKQSLLEAESLAERATRLVSVLQFRAFETRMPFDSAPRSKGRKPPH